MFHMKHRPRLRPPPGPRPGLPRLARPLPRRLAAAVAALAALLALGCATDLGSPDGWAAPVEAGGLVLVQDKPGELVAVRTGDGPARAAWRFPEDAALPAGLDRGDIDDLDALYATPIVDGDAVYLAAFSGQVLAVDLAGGGPNVRWLADLGDAVVGTPAFDARAGVLYVPTEGGALTPVDAATGAVGAPLARGGERFWSSPALGGGAVYVGGLDRRVRAVDPDGGEQWSSSLGGAVAGDLLLDGGTLYAPALDRALYALDAAGGGEERWRFRGDGWFWSRPLPAGDTMYAATTNGSVYAIDRRDGDELWRFREDDGEIRARPALAQGVLVVALREGVLFGLDPRTGRRLWRETLLRGQLLADPLEADRGLLYVTDGGDLVAVDPEAGTASIVYERS